jgi:UDP-glucose 4-epimerase
VLIAITGAAGAIGRSVTAALSDSHELVLVDSVAAEEATLYDPRRGERRVVPVDSRWPYRRADVRDPEGIRDAIGSAEVVLHLAGHLDGLWENAVAAMTTNAMGTFHLVHAAQQLGVRRVVNASSINAFGTIYWRVSGAAAHRGGRTGPGGSVQPQ